MPLNYLSHLGIGIMHNPNTAILIISTYRRQVNYFIDSTKLDLGIDNHLKSELH